MASPLPTRCGQIAAKGARFQCIKTLTSLLFASGMPPRVIGLIASLRPHPRVNGGLVVKLC
jgi:hypothetical protein